MPGSAPPVGWASHSSSFDQRRRPEALRTAMATAFFWPTSTTSRLPRVLTQHYAMLKRNLLYTGVTGQRPEPA